MSENETLTFQQEIVLEQMRRNYSFVQDALSSLDSKSQNVISTASIVITILSGIQLTNIQVNLRGWFLIVIALYILTIFFAGLALFPKTVKSEPLKADWETIVNNLSDPPFEFYHNILSTYVYTINSGLEINIWKKRCLICAYISLGLTVVISLLLSLG